MKKFFKFTGIAILTGLIVAALWMANLFIQPYDTLRIYLSLGPEAEVLTSDGVTYRDLNKTNV